MNYLDYIKTHKIVAIVRGVRLEDTLPVVQALYDGGIRVVEITLNTPNAFELIEIIVKKFQEKMLVGAGTVLSTKEVKQAIGVGAKFIISPNLNAEVVKLTKKLGAISIPGGFTPSEIVNAYTLGADIIKVFPATNGIEFIKNIRGPLPQIPLMPTGGVQLENIQDFKQVGAVAFGIGSALVDAKNEVNNQFLQELTHKAQQFVEAVK
jgi:2-dehydro-3-deoxyphosphogluconate aldolase / (4S)-4-hydroxy-2-oxoglutarate aldolase